MGSREGLNNIQETHIGKNTIIITTDNFSMESIIKIIIRDNHGESLFYKRNYDDRNSPKLTYFVNDNNEIELDLFAHPGKYYNLKLFNEFGGSKTFEFKRKEENIEISVKNIYYYSKDNSNLELPVINITGGYYDKIDKIYYKDDEDKFKNENQSFTGECIGNSYIATFPNKTLNGTFSFSYTLDGDDTKYSILNYRVTITNAFYSIILLLPPANYILTGRLFTLDVIPMFREMNLIVYLSKPAISINNLTNLKNPLKNIKKELVIMIYQLKI